MTDFSSKGFAELTLKDCEEINGGFAITIAGFTITGVTVAKWVGGWVIGNGIKHTWKRLHGQYD